MLIDELINKYRQDTLRITLCGAGRSYADLIGCMKRCDRETPCACRGVSAGNVASFFGLLPDPSRYQTTIDQIITVSAKDLRAAFQAASV